MRIAFFSARPYEREFFDAANDGEHELRYLEPRLTESTAALAQGCSAACLFVNDDGRAVVLRRLTEAGVRVLVLRSAGYNHIDLGAAAAIGLTVSHVPAYSPHAVAEHALALILTLNRKTHRAYNRVREGNFALDGLMGFDLHGRTVGVIGAGKIGSVVVRIMRGLGCRVMVYDPYPSPELDGEHVILAGLNEVLAASEIVSLHCPLTAATRHMLDAAAFARMREGVMLINTSRGGLIDTRAAIQALKTGRLGALGIDVYEEEAGLFFEDRSGQVLQDDVFARLLTFPNVLITGHQGFFTREAMQNIAAVTLANASAFASGGGTLHRVAMQAR
jgi:D-lactate dehydrogenase